MTTLIKLTSINLKTQIRWLAALALIIALALPGGVSAAESFKLVRGQSVSELAVFELDSGGFLDLGELSFALGGQLSWRQPGATITWSLGGVGFEFSDMIAFFSAGDGSYQLVAAPRLVAGRFLLPLQLAVEYLPRLLPARFEYDKPAGRLIDRGVKLSPSAQPKPSRPAVATHDGRSYRIRTVVLDPGHGGKDPGAVARRYKLNEKHIVLDLCRRVARLLKERSGLKVILTRDKDEFIALARRGRMANDSEAGLFVSVHVNASKNSGLDGSSTYFLSAAKTDEERATAMLENGALKYEVEQQEGPHRDEINLILQDMAQNEYLRESKDLSEFIQGELSGISGLRDRGLRQANFAVLRGAYMPAALVETAFISNRKDEQKLNTSAFRNKLAAAITSGIIKYIEQYHRKLANGS